MVSIRFESVVSKPQKMSEMITQLPADLYRPAMDAPASFIWPPDVEDAIFELIRNHAQCGCIPLRPPHVSHNALAKLCQECHIPAYGGCPG